MRKKIAFHCDNYNAPGLEFYEAASSGWNTITTVEGGLKAGQTAARKFVGKIAKEEGNGLFYTSMGNVKSPSLPKLVSNSLSALPCIKIFHCLELH